MTIILKPFGPALTYHPPEGKGILRKAGIDLLSLEEAKEAIKERKEKLKEWEDHPIMQLLSNIFSLLTLPKIDPFSQTPKPREEAFLLPSFTLAAIKAWALGRYLRSKGVDARYGEAEERVKKVLESAAPICEFSLEEIMARIKDSLLEEAPKLVRGAVFFTLSEAFLVGLLEKGKWRLWREDFFHASLWPLSLHPSQGFFEERKLFEKSLEAFVKWGKVKEGRTP